MWPAIAWCGRSGRQTSEEVVLNSPGSQWRIKWHLLALESLVAVEQIGLSGQALSINGIGGNAREANTKLTRSQDILTSSSPLTRPDTDAKNKMLVKQDHLRVPWTRLILISLPSSSSAFLQLSIILIPWHKYTAKKCYIKKLGGAQDGAAKCSPMPNFPFQGPMGTIVMYMNIIISISYILLHAPFVNLLSIVELHHKESAQPFLIVVLGCTAAQYYCNTQCLHNCVHCCTSILFK